MNITQEKIDDLNAIITLKVEASDYQENVNKILRDYRKKASMPGFRPGMVPTGVIQKMYGKQVLADELNKILSKELNSYIVDNKIEVLGSPIAKNSDAQLELKKDAEFEFSYELGLAPKFDVEISDKEKFTQYKIVVDDKLLDKYTEDIRRAYGKLVEGDKVEDKDLLTAQFDELDATGNVKEGGVSHKSSVAVDMIDDEKSKKALLGKKKGDTIVVDAEKISKSETDMAAMLGINKEDAANISKSFNLTIVDIRRSEPAELNTELFEKLYGKEEVKSIDEFKAKITTEIDKILALEADRKLRKDVSDELIKKAKLSLPDEFLKRWLVNVNEKPITLEEVTKEYETYSDSVKWQLIENKIIKKYEVKVTPEEAKEEANKMIRNQMAQYGMMDIPDADVAKYADTLLQQEQEARKLYQQIYDEKLIALFKEKFNIKHKDVTYDEFVDILKNKNENMLQKLNRSLFKR